MNHVPQEGKGADGHQQRTHGADLIDQRELRVVFRNPSWHSIETKPVLRSKAKVEANERECAVEASQIFIEHAPCELGIPVIDRGENDKNRSSKNDVMEVGYDEVSVMHMNMNERFLILDLSSEILLSEINAYVNRLIIIDDYS